MSGTMSTTRVDIIITASFTFAIKEELKQDMPCYVPAFSRKTAQQAVFWKTVKSEIVEQMLKLFHAYNNDNKNSNK